MEPAETHADEHASAGGHGTTADSSVSSAIEHLLASGQDVIATRIDLALLEGREALSLSLQRAAFGSFGMVLAIGAWFSGAACLVLLMTPNGNLVLRLAAFAALNAAGAFGFMVLAMRVRPPMTARTSADVPGETGET